MNSLKFLGYLILENSALLLAWKEKFHKNSYALKFFYTSVIIISMNFIHSYRILTYSSIWGNANCSNCWEIIVIPSTYFVLLNSLNSSFVNIRRRKRPYLIVFQSTSSSNLLSTKRLGKFLNAGKQFNDYSDSLAVRYKRKTSYFLMFWLLGYCLWD